MEGDAMILCIDIGNTTTDIGLYDGEGKLLLRSGLTTSPRASRDQCAISLLNVFQLYRRQPDSVDGAIISSVVPSLTAAMAAAVELLTGKAPLVMGPGVKTGLNIKSDAHTQMGTDIVACSVAAVSKYPSPVIVIDFGTAVTVSYLRDNCYEGCIIMPGVRLALDALSQRAAALPQISIEAPASILGHNTVDAMRSGVVYGSASQIDGMIDRLEAEASPAATIVATGGSGQEVLHYCKRKILYNADLLLDGLYLIYQKSTDSKRRRPSPSAHRREP